MKTKSLLRSTLRRTLTRVLPMVMLGAFPPACAGPSPPSPSRNSFIGTWATVDNNSVTIRQDTVIQTQPDGRTIALDPTTCQGVFRFGYDTKSREALTDLVSRQPGLRRKLSEMLVEPSYPVARLDCDRGDQTYVLLNDGELLAIYRDGDIGAIERLARR
jgi:hypothetical protein